MKCKNCGFDNPENSDVCQKCSAPLYDEEADVETEVTDSWGFLKPSRRGHGNEELNEEDISELEKSFWPSSEDDAGIRPVKSRKKVQDTQDTREHKINIHKNKAVPFSSDEKDTGSDYNDSYDKDYDNDDYNSKDYDNDDYNDKNYNDDDYDDSYDDDDYDDDYDDEKPPRICADKNKNTGRRGSSVKKLDWRKILGLCLIICAVVIIIVVIATSGSCRKQDGGSKDAIIMTDEANPGNKIIKVFAKRGSVLVYENSAGQQQETTVSKKGYVLFTVPIAALLPNEPIETATYEAFPIIYIKNPENGMLEKMENIGSVTIDVPTLTLTCENPASFECENGICTIKGKLGDISAGLFINNEQVAAAQDGSFEKELKFEAPGEYNIIVEARKNGYKTERISLSAVVAEPPDPGKIVEISEDFITRASHSAEFIEVKGKVPAGTQIAVRSDDPEFQLKAEPTVDAEGNFSFTVNLPRTEKNYTMTIVATLSSGTVIERPFCVQRPPTYSEFVQKCWAFSYDDVCKPALFGKQGFEIKGEISEIIEDGDYLKAKLTAAGGETLTIIYYDHYAAASHLEVGQSYVMYGIPQQLNADGTPEVFIWFVND